jgi:4'-phosphopantetheinyl transferase EntD
MVPSGVRVCETASSDEWLHGLTGEEQDLIRDAPPTLQRQFEAGRCLARAALGLLDRRWEHWSLLRDPLGLPVWPAGVVGSISHCRSHIAVAVAARDDVVSIGIDVEENHRVTDTVLKRISSAVELRNWLPGDQGWAASFFTAKEAAIKALTPLQGASVGFTATQIDLALSSGRFRGRCAVARHPAATDFEGAVASGPLLTGAVVLIPA